MVLRRRLRVGDGEAGKQRHGGERRANFEHDRPLGSGVASSSESAKGSRLPRSKKDRQTIARGGGKAGRTPNPFGLCRRSHRVNREVQKRCESQCLSRHSETGESKTAAHATEGSVRAVVPLARQLRHAGRKRRRSRHLIRMHAQYAAGAENGARLTRGKRQHNQSEGQKTHERRPPSLFPLAHQQHSCGSPPCHHTPHRYRCIDLGQMPEA